MNTSQTTDLWTLRLNIIRLRLTSKWMHFNQKIWRMLKIRSSRLEFDRKSISMRKLPHSLFCVQATDESFHGVDRRRIFPMKALLCHNCQLFGPLHNGTLFLRTQKELADMKGRQCDEAHWIEESVFYFEQEANSRTNVSSGSGMKLHLYAVILLAQFPFVLRQRSEIWQLKCHFLGCSLGSIGRPDFQRRSQPLRINLSRT